MSLRLPLSALMLAGVLAGAIPALAQTTTAPAPATSAPAHRHHGNRYMRTLRSLGLSSDQQTRIKAIAQSYRAKDRNADAATRKADRAAMRSQIEAVLTPDQRTKLAAAMATR